MIPLYDLEIGITHNRITDPNAVIDETWGYIYDCDFFTGVPNPMDWRVREEWVGKTAKEICPLSWSEFVVPIADFSI
jgi:hypothetical protein